MTIAHITAPDAMASAEHAAESPIIQVLLHRRLRACASLKGEEQEGVFPLEPMPLVEAMQTRFDTDAHFVCYDVPDEPRVPRLKKRLLSTIREQGRSVECRVLALDWDRLDESGQKLAWASAAEASAELDEIIAVGPLIPTYAYSTKNGLRLVWALSEPVVPEVLEALIRVLFLEYAAAGVQVDEACSDWTRLFRLPRVNREKHGQTEDTEYFTERWLGSPLVVDDWIEATKTVSLQPRRRPARERPVKRPSIEAAQAHLWKNNPATGRKNQTEFYKRAKKRLEGRECCDHIFFGEALATAGTRNDTMQSMVGQACAMLSNVEGACEEAIFGLFIDSVEKLEPDEETPDWFDVLWEAVCKWWDAEAAKHQVTADAMRELMDGIISGMREWCDAPELHNADCDVAWRYCETRLIAVGRRDYHVIEPDGYYATHGVPSEHLAVRIRELGLDRIIGITELTPSGPRTVPTRDLIRRHGVTLTEIRGEVQRARAIVQGMTTDERVLIVPLYRRREDLDPCFNEEVDEWLRMLAGDDATYDYLCRWIAYALAFEEGPICALVLLGAPGVGKKLFAQGLVECINTETRADPKELGRFQSQLLRTPFLIADEGFPKLDGGASHIADTFRRLTAGEILPIERKGKDIIYIRNPIRMLVTSNSGDPIKTLVGDRNLEEDDRRAIALRLKVVKVGQEAAHWLESRGGFEFTKGWIRPDAGGECDHTVARHFLWLYEHRDRWQRDSRLLVSGDLDKSALRELAVKSGCVPLVMEVIISMLNSVSLRAGLVLNEEGLWVLAQPLAQYYREHINKHGERRDLGASLVGQTLRGIRADDAREGSRRIYDPCREALTPKQRWHKIDVDALAEFAHEHGFECRRLTDYVAGRSAAMGASE